MSVRRQIIDACLHMERAGINQGTSGNVSTRAGDGCLITPSGVPYADMTPAQVVRIGADGRVQGSPRGGARALAPSSEWRMHVDIYAHFAAAGAVVHAHPPHATALACHGRGIPPFHYMVAVAGGTDIRCAGYATFGTAALSRHMIDALDGRRACLLANHGMICFAADLDAALALAIEVESLARQYLLALAIGEPPCLDEVQMAEVIEKFRNYGRRD